jgi:hypothetical protein
MRAMQTRSTDHKESNGYAYVSVNVADREALVRDTEMLTGMLQSRKELLGDRGEVECLFAYYPADPKLNFEGNLHHADPLILRNAPLPTVFFTRRHWFDLQTGLIVARQCGCKAGPDINSNYVPETNIDYPAPESLTPDLFIFSIPADAKVITLNSSTTGSP